MAEQFTHSLRVRWNECDPQGIVFNGNYLVYFDVVFNEMWHEAIAPWSEIVARGVDTVLAATSLMVGADAAADAVERARRLPDLRVGLHLVLADGHSATRVLDERSHV